MRLLRMAKSVDPDQTGENDSADLDQTDENGRYCRPSSDCWERQTVQTLIRLKVAISVNLIRLLRMANSVAADKTAENGK